MARFFENIFRALVLLFAGIAMLDTMGVPVTGLLTGAGRCRHRHLACGAVHPIEPHCRCSAGAGAFLWNWGLHRAGQSGGHGGGISFRSTKFRTPDNVVVSIENSKVASEYICNCDQRKSRLWDFTVGVTYDTPRETLEVLCRDLTAVLQNDPEVLADKVTVTVDTFKAYSIDLRCRMYVTTTRLADFLQAKNR